MLKSVQFAALQRPEDPRSVVADVVVYGATPGGICAAVSASRHGLSVALVGGWREFKLGGMMSGGLCATDLQNPVSLGGLSREVFDRLDAIFNRARNSSFQMTPSVIEYVFQQMIAEQNISVYWTRGISGARKEGNRLSGFQTRDGLTAQAKVFVDASYEGDLIAFAGVPYHIGREAMYEFGEVHAGFHMNNDDVGFSWKGEPLFVDPYIVPGVPGSGTLAGIHPVSAGGILGNGDAALQAYNFRTVTTNRPENRRALPTSAPRNYDPARYEILARWIEAIQEADPSYTLTMLNFMSASFLPQGKYDVNNRGPFSTDQPWSNWQYGEAGFNYATNRAIDYDLREAIWQDQIDYQMGFFWWIQDPANTRCPATVRDSFRLQWLCLDEYNIVWPGDPLGWSTQYYVREARRMRSEIVLIEQDVRRPDSADLPWPNSVVGCASYSMDSHNTNKVLQEFAPGQFRTWLEGGIHVLAGGINNLIPFPYEILRPRKVDCDNLLTPWAVSATHCAMAVTRMEPTSMLMGHICGVAARMALDGFEQAALQDIDIATLRETLRREGIIGVDLT